ncbi:MAG TPA: S41 family peptidase [Propionibacteriaceae bacterium]
MPVGYLRFPDVREDLVTFCAADDLWLAPFVGGRAWRLTSDSSPVRDPKFSPDGTRVAWTSSRDGHWEVMVLALDEGEASRLTYWGHPTTKLLAWADDDTLLVASAAGEANGRQTYVKAVSLDGHVERRPYGLAGGVAVSASGLVAVSTPGSRPPAAWKRYRGGTASRLWLSEPGGQWRQILPDETASLVSPSWVGDRLVFASDLEATFPDHAHGQANLYSVSASGDDLVRHTAHTEAEGYVRDPATDGRRLVYHARGALFGMTGLTAAPRAIEITLGSAVSGRRPRLLEPSEQLEQVRPDHSGDASVVSWRGKGFYLSHREGPARALAADGAVRIREPRVLADLGLAVMVSDAEGEDALEVHALDNAATARRLATGQLGRVLALEADPAGRQVATISHDGRISVTTLADGVVRTVGTSLEGEPAGLAFSPDGRYLVWSEPVGHRERLMLAGLVGDQPPVPLTSGRFRDFSPRFTLDGRYLALLSARTFDPSYDAHVFDLTFSSATRPYLIPLAATTPAPFGPSAEGWRVSEGSDDASVTGPVTSAESSESANPEIELDGFEERIVPFPVPAGNYRQIRAVTTGVTWVHEAPTGGVLGAARSGVDGDPPVDSLELFSFKSRKVETLADKVSGYAVSGDGRRIVVRDGSAVTVVPADRKVKTDDPARVEVDLDRLRYELDPVAEWVQMFDENARIMRDHYWRADMNGVDWDACVARYRPLVPNLASHDDLVDLLWETVGELNTSHAYVTPAAPLGDQERRLGLLGADLSPAPGEGWRIDRILPGESSDPDARSPLRAAGVGVRPGDVVVAVNGRPVDAQFGPVTALVGAAEKPTELTVRRPGQEAGNERRVVVLPVRSEDALRYQAWVAERTDYVSRTSGGRLGYLHIPDMVSAGWAQFHRAVDIATRAEGLIVDVRYNRGGHTSQLVIERLARRVIGWTTSRHHGVQGDYPSQSARGPLILVTNEFAGSDGDIVNAAAQALGLGPVVGVRTWGGVVGIDGRFQLVDGTAITQPRYAFWLQGYGWTVENRGIDPDIEVAMTPADWHSEGDPQLDRAVSEALERLEQSPAASPPALPEPRVRRNAAEEGRA